MRTSLESKIEVATNEVLAILAGLEVLRNIDDAAQPEVLVAIQESAAKLVRLVDEMSPPKGGNDSDDSFQGDT